MRTPIRILRKKSSLSGAPQYLCEAEIAVDSGVNERLLRYGLGYFITHRSAAELLKKGIFRGYSGLLGGLPWSKRAECDAWERIANERPCVFLSSLPFWEGANCVTTDEHASIHALAEHLYHCGHRAIGYVAARCEGYSHERFRAYRNAMHTLGLPVRQAWVHGFDVLSGRAQRDLVSAARLSGKRYERVMSRVFEQVILDGTTAVMFEVDSLAHQFCAFAEHRGIRIGHDIAVTGFDDIRDARGMFRKLSATIAQDFFGIGRAGADMLHGIITGKRPTVGQRALVPGKLIVRKATSCLAGIRSGAGIDAAIRDHIEEHSAESSLPRTIASAFDMTRAAFARNFKRLFRQSLVRYINDVRLARAENLVAAGHRSFSHIAIMCGFSSQQLFTMLFRKRYGTSPRDYRNMKAAGNEYR
ncbi:MAG: substrate-binding domain-containing protein [Spirochaetota bacterium]